MRMAGAVTLGILIIEALLAGAFALGYYWLDGIQWGLLFSGVMLLLIVLPWPGELKVVFDSDGPKGAVRVGWWGRASFARRGTATQLVVRVLGIPIRRRIEDTKAEPETGEAEAPEEADAPPEFEPAAEEGLAEERAPESEENEVEARRRPAWWRRIDSETVEGLCRVVGSSLGATCELVWGAEEIRISVRDAAEHAVADAVLEQVIGRRQVGPVDVTITSGDCDRRVRAIYRIGLLRAALAGAQVIIDGRALSFARRMKEYKECVEVDEDQRMIEKIVEQGALREEDED